ncbi:MAG: peptidoglycan-binding protein [Eubacteriales bacterium]
MKYKNYFLLVAGLLISLAVLFTPSEAAAMPYFEDATVITDDMQVMIRPWEDSGVVTTLRSGVEIGVFCEEREGWYRIIYGNYRGYAKVDDVFLPSTDILYGNSLVDDLVIKENPSPYGTLMGTLNAGYPLTIEDIEGDYYYVVATDLEGKDVEGYVEKEHVNQTASGKSEMVLEMGMEGAEVRKMQRKLFERGFYGYSADGVFSKSTKTSLGKFQKHAGLEQTGIADAETLELLYSDQDIHSYAQDRGVNNSVMMASWWDTVQFEFGKGKVATITDVRTGKSFKVQRYSGHNHADCEPLTAEDTAIMRSIYGGWAWDRRAIWVTIGGTTYAASMNGMPHAADEARISGNGFNGHFCVHFKNSYGHGSAAEDSEHQRMVSSAYASSIY